jgi:polyisoprenoid-binding protein YceI
MSMRRRAARTLTLALALVAAVSTAAGAAEYRIDDAQSIFAILTHKAGIGSSLAHDHLIVAPKPAVRLDFDPASPETAKLDFSLPVSTLEIDAPEPRAAWKGRFKELGIQSGELPPVSESDRKKVREAMLGEGQLNAAKFPEIRAELLALERGKGEGKAIVKLRITIRGKSVERQLPATWSEKDGTLTADVVGELRFTEFGIEPYSTLLGAIRNDDLIHLFVHAVARRAP